MTDSTAALCCTGLLCRTCDGVTAPVADGPHSVSLSRGSFGEGALAWAIDGPRRLQCFTEDRRMDEKDVALRVRETSIPAVCYGLSMGCRP